MPTDLFDPLSAAFRDALSDLITVAVRGGLLFWGVFMGKILSTGFFESPSWKKISLISMPITVVIAGFFAFYGFKWVVNPGETKAEAIHDAAVTFFLVLVPLWAGCIWGAMQWTSKPSEKHEGDA